MILSLWIPERPYLLGEFRDLFEQVSSYGVYTVYLSFLLIYGAFKIIQRQNLKAALYVQRHAAAPPILPLAMRDLFSSTCLQLSPL